MDTAGVAIFFYREDALPQDGRMAWLHNNNKMVETNDTVGRLGWTVGRLGLAILLYSNPPEQPEESRTLNDLFGRSPIAHMIPDGSVKAAVL